MSPIKALLNNQEHRLRRYYELVGRRIGVWHGDVTASEKKRVIAEPPDCLLTTPESLEVLLVSKNVPHQTFLRNVQAIVIDEVHAFASDDRGWHLLSLIARISRLARRDIQRVGLSATVGNPEFLAEWLGAGSERPGRVIRPEGRPENEETPEVELDYVGSLGNAAQVIHTLHRGQKRLVFVDSRSRVEELAAHLRNLGTKTFVSHSSLGIDERRLAEQAFAEGDDCVIVATSALELGIDVGDLDRVVQIDAPTTVSSFLQRMGRTGRRPGSTRNCLFLATTDESLLRAAGLIELWSEGYIEPVEPPATPHHIFAQQIMALALQEGGIGIREAVDWLRPVPPFGELTAKVIDEVIGYMLEKEILWRENDILWLGGKGEETYGRRNYLELFAVFSSPPLFSVMHGRQELGHVHQSTFSVRQEGPVALLLGGRSWEVKHLDWKKRIAFVRPSEERGRSRWKGEGQWLSFRLCQAIRGLLESDEEKARWSKRARAQFEEVRDAFTWLRPDGPVVVPNPRGGVTWWTFGGGAANAALAATMETTVGIERGSFDNFAVHVKSDVPVEALGEAIEKLRSLDIAEIVPRITDEALERLKFSECLPPDRAVGVLRRRLVDREALFAILR